MITNKCKSSGFLGEAVSGDVDVSYLSIFLKQRMYVLTSGFEVEIVHLQACHPIDVRRRSISASQVTWWKMSRCEDTSNEKQIRTINNQLSMERTPTSINSSMPIPTYPVLPLQLISFPTIKNYLLYSR